MPAFLALSGGLDSTVLLSELIKADTDDCIYVYFFDYGSKHNNFEIESAHAVFSFYYQKYKNLFFDTIDLKNIIKKQQYGSSALIAASGQDIPEGHYEAPEMSATVVPGRNMMFVSILAGIAQSYGGGQILFGAHRGDSLIYPDCRFEWVAAMRTAIRIQTFGKLELKTPFLEYDKTGIVGLGLRNTVPLNLTRTCYKNQSIACGKCGACNERKEAFINNHAIDPIQYEFNGPIPQRS